jgi:hypothetical protein
MVYVTALNQSMLPRLINEITSRRSGTSGLLVKIESQIVSSIHYTSQTGEARETESFQLIIDGKQLMTTHILRL